MAPNLLKLMATWHCAQAGARESESAVGEDDGHQRVIISRDLSMDLQLPCKLSSGRYLMASGMGLYSGMDKRAATMKA